jgi:hypothetical protein
MLSVQLQGEDTVDVGLVERSLVVWVFRVSPGVVPRSLVGSDGILQARKIGDDEDSTAYLFNIGSFWAVRLEDVPFLVRGSSRGV